MILPNMQLSESEYNLLTKYHSEVTERSFGSEAIVTQNGMYAEKIFRATFGKFRITPEKIEQIRENKFHKVVALFKMGDTFPNQVKPLHTYSYQGKFVGYRTGWSASPLMEKIKVSLDRDFCIIVLKKIREKLSEFHQLGIIYGDIKDNNIFVAIDNGEVVIDFGDLDNMKVGDYAIDAFNKFSAEFVKDYGKVDEKLDSYMCNLLTLEYLNNCKWWYDDVVRNLEIGRLPGELNMPNNRNKSKVLIREMVQVTPQYSGDYFIDLIAN